MVICWFMPLNLSSHACLISWRVLGIPGKLKEQTYLSSRLPKCIMLSILASPRSFPLHCGIVRPPAASFRSVRAGP
ncbi:hypothetical protein BGZ63DRAFT_52231 [Mariannaea sp. PMI_226]|nr:hypothetical protein BGZ63DRAFT_52231 [Mariannaea sp. PMI_226]